MKYLFTFLVLVFCGNILAAETSPALRIKEMTENLVTPAKSIAAPAPPAPVAPITVTNKQVTVVQNDSTPETMAKAAALIRNVDGAVDNTPEPEPKGGWVVLSGVDFQFQRDAKGNPRIFRVVITDSKGCKTVSEKEYEKWSDAVQYAFDHVHHGRHKVWPPTFRHDKTGVLAYKVRRWKADGWQTHYEDKPCR